MSRSVVSYATYSGVGATNGIMNTQAPKPLSDLEQIAGALNMQSTDQLPFLFKMFPDAVTDGTLTMVNGSMYYSGMSVLDIVTLAVSFISVVVLILKSAGDLKTFITSTKLSTIEAEIKALEKKKLEAELALLKGKDDSTHN